MTRRGPTAVPNRFGQALPARTRSRNRPARRAIAPAPATDGATRVSGRGRRGRRSEAECALALTRRPTRGGEEPIPAGASGRGV